METGERICGFEIIGIVELEELKARGIWARHNSGAEVFHVLNDDPENLFSFAFSTAPDDSSGVSHILEHSVLCGSEKYPLKDSFLVLAQGSLQTFLNAWTFPDKTVYPASSVNEKDYFNLMSVYADAVFRPLLSEWTFMQEGWRLVPAKSGLEYTGVVYNEMKGSYSSMDTYAGHWSIKSVMPDTPYAHESGGDPDCIPGLSWEALKEFHRSRYVPANCRIFLAGNIPTEKQFSCLDNCLSGLSPGNAAVAVPKAARWDKNVTIRVPCPGSEKPQAIVPWLCTDSTDTRETMALACIAEILLGHDGAPLTRTLVESGLGEDLSPVIGLESELRETVFSAGLRGVFTENGNTKNACQLVENLILDTLRRLLKEGIPKEEIDAALLNMEFSHREIKRSHGPYSLVWMRRSYRTWLYGKQPWDSLLFVPAFSELKQRITGSFGTDAEGNSHNKYLESLIEKYLLSNPHRALVIIESEADFLEKKDRETAARLKETRLGQAEIKSLKEKNKTLEKIQAKKEPKEILEAVPHLTRSDLTVNIETVPTEFTFLEGSADASAKAPPCLAHPIFTNGVSYADMAFPVDVLDIEDYPWLPFFARSIVSMGLPGMDYGEVSTLLARTAGGFYALLETGSTAPQPGKSAMAAEYLGRDWIIYRIKALDEKLDAALDLSRRMITEADFSDLRRLKDLALEMKNDNDSSLAPAGHQYASSCSGKFFSRSRAADEIWNGLGQIAFSHELAAMDMGALKERMEKIRDRLALSGVLLNITSSPDAVPNALKAAGCFGSFGSPKMPNPDCSKKETLFGFLQKRVTQAGLSPGSGAEVFSSPSLQVGFAAMSLPAAPYGTAEHAAEMVFSHELRTGPLWESIRMMGGAYGAMAVPNNLEKVFSFSTYRDPDPLRSLDAISKILKRRSAEGIDRDSLEKFIIGTYARETRPQSPAEKGFAEFLRTLYGISDDHRLTRLKDIVTLDAEAANAAARRLAKAAEEGPCCPVIITGEKTAASAAKKIKAALQELPV